MTFAPRQNWNAYNDGDGLRVDDPATSDVGKLVYPGIWSIVQTSGPLALSTRTTSLPTIRVRSPGVLLAQPCGVPFLIPAITIEIFSCSVGLQTKRLGPQSF